MGDGLGGGPHSRGRTASETTQAGGQGRGGTTPAHQHFDGSRQCGSPARRGSGSRGGGRRGGCGVSWRGAQRGLLECVGPHPHAPQLGSARRTSEDPRDPSPARRAPRTSGPDPREAGPRRRPAAGGRRELYARAVAAGGAAAVRRAAGRLRALPQLLRPRRRLRRPAAPAVLSLRRGGRHRVLSRGRLPSAATRRDGPRAAGGCGGGRAALRVRQRPPEVGRRPCAPRQAHTPLSFTRLFVEQGSSRRCWAPSRSGSSPAPAQSSAAISTPPRWMSRPAAGAGSSRRCPPEACAGFLPRTACPRA